MLRVEARLRRRMLVGGLTLGIGLLAVLLAIVYRITTAAGKALPIGTIEAKMPPGAKLLSTSIDGGRIVLTYETAGGTTLILIDATTLRPIGRLNLTPE